MNAFEQDHAYLRAGLDELEPYLLSKELYYPLGGSLPRLTIGGLLLAFKRVKALGAGDDFDVRLDTVRGRWRVAWENKARREFHNRTELWRNFLADYTANPDQFADSYRSEVRVRVMLALLARELAPPGPDDALLASTDALLKGRLIPSGFVWDSALESTFPKDEFWFMYGTLKSR